MYQVELKGVTAAGYGFTQTHEIDPDEIGEFLTRLIPDFESTSVFEMKVVYRR